jgi:short-subunit dehydrogenase
MQPATDVARANGDAFMPSDIALVTGASTDTGYHIAHRLCAHGHSVVLVAAVEGELDWIAAELLLQGADVRAITCDMESSFGPQQVFEELASDDLRVGILANNTGLARNADVAYIPIERHLATLRINAEVARGLTALVLPGMLARGRGHIVNLLSATRYASAAVRSACAAANALMLSWNDALAAELEGTPINVAAFAARPSEENGLTQHASSYDIARAAYADRATRERCIVVGARRFELPVQLPASTPDHRYVARAYLDNAPSRDLSL